MGKLCSWSRHTTFMLGGIADSKCKMVKNVGQRLDLLFTGAEKISKFPCNSCKNGGPKPHRAFAMTMCGSRTGGWSLPGVMSDWQRCVDWFLAKYCRCRLWLDSCWCRWRTSAKDRCRWGLHVRRRQVGFVRGTRWPARSSAGRMVARTARWSRWQFLSWATEPRLSRDFVGAKSWVVIGGGYIKFAGFMVVHQKIIGLLGGATKPRPKTGRGCQAKTGLTSLENWSDWFGVARRRKLRAEDTRRDRKTCVEATRNAIAGHPSDGVEDKFPKCPWWVCILVQALGAF
jgi:hypothetical protein